MITSKQNQLIKLIRSLSDKKTRDEHSLFIVEGVKSVKEALISNFLVEQVLFTEKYANSLDGYIKDVKTELITPELMKYVSTEVTPQGVLALVKKPNFACKEQIASAVFLDGVSDPGNVGAIIRTAVACGITDIFITPDSADPYSQKAVRASMSGIFKCKIYLTLREEVKSIIRVPLIVADMDGENVFTTKNNEEFCLIIGNEAHGVSTELLSLADKVVSIPMQNGVESLNASVSAGILMYALKR